MIKHPSTNRHANYTLEANIKIKKESYETEGLNLENILITQGSCLVFGNAITSSFFKMGQSYKIFEQNAS